MTEQLNLALVEGRLVKDPELKQTENGKSFCKFDIASNRFYLDGDNKVEETTFIGIMVWNRVAETCAKFLKKGKLVRVNGRLHQFRWKDDTGQNKQKIFIKANTINFLSRANKNKQFNQQQTDDNLEVQVDEPSASFIGAEAAIPF